MILCGKLVIQYVSFEKILCSLQNSFYFRRFLCFFPLWALSRCLLGTNCCEMFFCRSMLTFVVGSIFNNSSAIKTFPQIFCLKLCCGFVSETENFMWQKLLDKKITLVAFRFSVASWTMLPFQNFFCFFHSRRCNVEITQRN